MTRLLACLFGTALCCFCAAQPYLDVGAASFSHSPTRLDRAELALSLPLRLGKGKIILSPFWENWQARLPQQTAFPEENTESLTGCVLPVTWLTPICNTPWKLLLTGLVRYNMLNTTERSSVQPGGALLFTYSKKTSLTWKAGFYANRDAFGVFWLPLLGIDWRAGPKLNVWGVLPGSMHAEHKVLRWLHWGFVFKAFTNSYGERGGFFARTDENQVGLFADTYLMGTRAVLRLEGGHTAFSQYQGGPGHPRYALLGSRGYVDHELGDGPYFKVMLAYRVRLDGENSPN